MPIERVVVNAVMEPIQALRNAGLWSEELVQLLKQQAGE